MTDIITTQGLIREARRQIRSLKRPAGVQRNTWKGIIDILAVIAGYLPDPYPSQRHIAAKLDLHRTTVTRRLAAAEDLGLISRAERPNPDGFAPGTTYRLLCLSEALKAAVTRTQIQDTNCTQTRSSSSKKTNGTTPPEWFLSSALRALDSDTQEAAVARRDPNDESNPNNWGPATGQDPDDLGPSLVVPPVDPAIRLAQVFDDHWADAKRRSPGLRTIRASSRGMAIGYLRNILIPENGPEHAEAYITAFTQSAVDGDIEFSDGQFAFERFTAWWGREPVEDPGIKAKERAFTKAVLDEYRRLHGSG